jgi:hypothetical protein
MSSSISGKAANVISSPVVIANTADMKKEFVVLTGSCYCRNITYQLKLASLDDARTSLCHCKSCKKAFGGAFGLTAKVPLQTFRYMDESKTPVVGGTLFRDAGML